MITRRGVLSSLTLGATSLVAGAGLLGIVPEADAAKNRNTQEHRRNRRRNKKQRRRERRRG